ncbi:ATP-grasp domain-containing protein [Aquimarina sp. U1-2]|uniref:ATP-grasp domain-containing protein n=1 Tax=Aquimarina sp. U1-2 TaxID=2823141 RepID=UPI001AECD4E3|nr:ATP-grasp domain-containing protein [Aquimarina sp. U1-2]MBP2833845.1 ATP-grasp domain-containing protein [Aquimarina sp. U1-2]
MNQKKSTLESTKIAVLIPDGESHLLIYVVNCLSQIPGISIFVMSSLKWNPVRFSKHISKFIYHPATQNDRLWIQTINAEVKNNNIEVIMPIFEKGIRRIIENKQSLDQKSRLVPLPDLNTFTTTINKWKLARYCTTNKLPIPKSFTYKPGDDLSTTFLNEIRFPVIVKPLEGFGGGLGIHVFTHMKELQKYVSKTVHYSIIVQEFIEGYDIDCSILAKDGKIIAYTIQKGYMQGESPYAPQIGLQFLNNPKLLEVVENLIRSLCWDGIAHLDLRYDENDNTYKIIELNPRFWASVDASCLMGINFPHLLIQQTLGYEIQKTQYKHEKYLNLKGFVKTLRKRPFFLRQVTFILRNTQFRFVIYDMAPTIFKFLDRSKNLLLLYVRKNGHKRKPMPICRD